MQRPAPGEYKPYFDRYISLVDEDDILGLLERQIAEIQALLGSLSEEQSRYRYAEGKWSVRGVVDHLIDAERIFGYRALAVSRGDTHELPSFDENEYAAASDADRRDLPGLLDELAGARRSNLAMMRRFDDGAWSRIGAASGGPISPRALAFILAGHQRHHVRILRERYGLDR
jgi:uncharacterized damage-inducible protein DinB